MSIVFFLPGRWNAVCLGGHPTSKGSKKGDIIILRLSLNLPEDATYVRTTRLLSRALLQDMNVNRGIIDDVEVIVTELYSNVIRHAQSKASHFLMTLEYFKSQVIIVVQDEGQGFIAEELPLPGSKRSDGQGGERYGGFGMTLLKGLSDKIDFSMTDPHGTTVRIEKQLLYETQADADMATSRDAGRGASADLGGHAPAKDCVE